jgi:hypothetical protein
LPLALLSGLLACSPAVEPLQSQRQEVTVSTGTLADLWEGRAVLVEDTRTFGADFGMHFLSGWWEGGTLWSYYIQNYPVDGVWRFATGLAQSTDGTSFTNRGRVLDIGGAWQWVYNANGGLQHQTGRADGDGWSANTLADAPGFLSYGPYATDVAEGRNTVTYALLVDNNSADDSLVVTLDVRDATTGQVLARRDVRRREFNAPWAEQLFVLPYTQTAGHMTEFRTYWHRTSYVKQRLVSVSQGEELFSDNRLASFPGVWKDAEGWWLTYEAAGLSSQWPGDIGLARSTSGTRFIKDARNPILRHQTSGWERTNIGTPSLWKEGSTWYLFYHGFDGTDVQVGVATGTDLRNLTRSSGNPILRTGTGGAWDSGTIGKRSIWKEGSYYYMVYEGSTEQPYDTARWSSGIARSTNLLTWEKWSGNPVLPQTSSGFGYDGPEWIRTPEGKLHVYFRAPTGGTKRATLTPCKVYNATTDLSHQIGRAEGDGWAAATAYDAPAFLTHGPYDAALSAGNKTVTFSLLVDNNSADNLPVVTLEVYDVTAGRIVAQRQVRRTEFVAPWTYQTFRLGYVQTAGHTTELRTYWHDTSYVRQRHAAVCPP